VKPSGHFVVVIACIVWLSAVTAACGARRGTTTEPTVPAPVQSPDAATPASSESVAATTPPPPPPPAAPPAEPDAQTDKDTDGDGCALIAEPGEPIATIALVERIDPSHAPYPQNESERLLFRQIYETLIRVDCNGRVRPGLAASWRLEADGHTWIVTLRDGVQFTDGTAVTSGTVRESWAGDYGTDLSRAARRLLKSAAAIDDRTLAITLRNPDSGDPLALAHTDLAVVRDVPGSPWPLGTRGVSVEPGTPTALAEQVLALKRNDLPPLRVIAAARDPRDLLGAGIDLLVTRDPATLAYAATLPEFQQVPMEWQRTQVLLQPGRPHASPALSEDGRQRLAADAIRGEARGAVGPFWWETTQDCDGLSDRLQPQLPLTPRIVHDGNDAAARDLAERLVAVARASGPAAPAIANALLPDRPRRDYQRTAALTGAPLLQAIRRGADAGYILSMDRRPFDPCREFAVTMEGAPWLDRETIVPIADTRLHAIVRRGKAGAATEWDGGLVLSAPTAASK
jgi:Bacterial extracellular solute-binding proteins, family 5 Middle